MSWSDVSVFRGTLQSAESSRSTTTIEFSQPTRMRGVTTVKRGDDGKQDVGRLVRR